MTSKTSTSSLPGRLQSLDFFRGLTMFLLVSESAHLYQVLIDPQLGSTINAMGTQFHHHPWNGLRFWDLIQPFFMFIVGVAIPFAVANRQRNHQTENQIRRHVFKRALILLLLGWGLYCVGSDRLVFRFQNVLAQLSVTYLIAYLIMHKSVKFQILFSLCLLVLTEILYRTFWVEGFNHPFVANENFGTWLDMQYGGEDLGGHWVSFNAIPTTAHTIWGVLAGQLLQRDLQSNKKIKYLLIGGAITLVAGYALDPMTPIIKRICTSSFVLASGGWALLALAFSYWLIDVKNMTGGLWIFTLVGMNSIFIYLFANIGGADFFRGVVHPYIEVTLGRIGELGIDLMTAVVVLFLLWYLCYWLYKKRIFFKI